MPRPSITSNRRPTTLRAGLSSLAGAAAWAGIVATAIVFYEPMAQHGRVYRNGELLGFATAFAVSGTIAAIAATAVYGTWRRAVLTALFAVVLMPLPALEIARVIIPARLRSSTILDWLRTGAILGVPVGLIASVPVSVLGVLTRRRLSWRIGLAAAAAIAVSMVWIIPAIVGMSWLASTRIRDELDLNLGATYGGSVGSIMGAICGAVIGAMMARWPAG